MGLQFFAPQGADGLNMQLPLAFKRTVRWLPQIGDIFPDFTVDTTQRRLKFWDWAEDSWTFLFSHPAACTAVCTTELGALARTQSDYADLGAKVLGLTSSTIDEQTDWHKQVERLYNAQVWFPTAFDPDAKLTSLFGMCHAKEHRSFPIRKSFILDPQMRIRMIFEYPMFIGRSIEKTLRVIEALQMQDKTGAATPADWYPGDPVIIPDQRSEGEVMRMFGAHSQQMLPYLRLVLGKEV